MCPANSVDEDSVGNVEIVESDEEPIYPRATCMVPFSRIYIFWTVIVLLVAVLMTIPTIIYNYTMNSELGGFGDPDNSQESRDVLVKLLDAILAFYKTLERNEKLTFIKFLGFYEKCTGTFLDKILPGFNYSAILDNVS